MNDNVGYLSPAEREAIREKNLQEREKRIRNDGVDQYVEPTGKFSYLEEDPYTPIAEREPLKDHVTFAFIGGGFSGLCAGARLREAGISDFRIIESGGDFGGVWYWNRYPGAMCDTAAMVYLPLLEETGYMPTEKYVQAHEIWGHAKRIAEQYDLAPHAVFSTKVTNLTWNESDSVWVIETDRGDCMTAKYVAAGTGPLSRPKLPGIPGIDTFKGNSFHTARWDYDYTGGDWTGSPMENLKDKRVGIIGTGATAIQCIPPLGRDAGSLSVFQRTPSAVDVRNNHPIEPNWFKDLPKGWQGQWLTNFATLQTSGLADEDLVHDGWTDIGIRIRDRLLEDVGRPDKWTPDAVIRCYECTDDAKMVEIRQRIDDIVSDPETASSLKPWYRQFCKRPCFHDEYLPAFNRPNVRLVDTDGKGVERIDETGVWVDGVHHELDCLVFASGFEFNTDYTRRSGFDITGIGGVTLADRWQDGMETLHGMHVHDFPNLFIVGFVQAANLGANLTSNLADAAKTIAAIVRHAEDTSASVVECLKTSEQEWVRAIEEAEFATIVGGEDCTPGYYNNEGKPEGRRHKLNTNGYPPGAVEFFNYIEEWRTSGEFEGLEFRKTAAIR
ncbi:MAG: NAD(P)-binding protein [Pseudomonadales bacterium]|nr:NAD(P)-binding protein [Pseudomonadales bacterium]